jgi:hypothetical protein
MKREEGEKKKALASLSSLALALSLSLLENMLTGTGTSFLH